MHHQESHLEHGYSRAENVQELVERIVNELKAKHVRITEPRRAILRYMIESHTHPTVEEIYEDLLPQYPGMSLATVYNNLNILVEHGYVYEMKFSDIKSRYDFMGNQHFHIICENCGKIADFPARDVQPIEQDAAETTGYSVRSIGLEVFGICPDCQK